MRNQNKEIWKFRQTLTFRLAVAILDYVTYCLATFVETFGLRSGSIMETFMEGKRFEICLSPFSDLCASCHTQLRSLLINLEFGKRFKVNYEYIYLYIYIVYAIACYRVSGHRSPWLSQLNRILWFIFLQKQVF